MTKLDETELITLNANYLQELNIEDLDLYDCYVDTYTNKITGNKKCMIENINKIDTITTTFDFDQNRVTVEIYNYLINCETHTTKNDKSIYSMTVLNDKFLKGYYSETYKNNILISTNTYSNSIDVPEGYTILDGYPKESIKKTK